MGDRKIITLLSCPHQVHHRHAQNRARLCPFQRAASTHQERLERRLHFPREEIIPVNMPEERVGLDTEEHTSSQKHALRSPGQSENAAEACTVTCTSEASPGPAPSRREALRFSSWGRGGGGGERKKEGGREKDLKPLSTGAGEKTSAVLARAQAGAPPFL